MGQLVHQGKDVKLPLLLCILQAKGGRVIRLTARPGRSHQGSAGCLLPRPARAASCIMPQCPLAASQLCACNHMSAVPTTRCHHIKSNTAALHPASGKQQNWSAYKRAHSWDLKTSCALLSHCQQLANLCALKAL